LKVLDLFSGCGGFSYGFQDAGFNVLLGIDNTPVALDTFRLNHTNSEVFNIDLSKDENLKQIVDFLEERGGADVIIAGPPCQGFSLTGSREEDDDRNRLFYAVFSISRLLKNKPKAIIIENVTGLATLYGGKAKKEIERNFEENGYIHNSKVLYAPDYGIPQIRKRLFLVGLRERYGLFSFPEPILDKDKYITCEDAIADLPTLENDLGTESVPYISKPLSTYQKKMRKKSNIIQNHIGTKHTDLVKSVIAQVPEGGNHKDLPKGVGESRKFNEAWTRYHSKKPSKTIDTGHRNHFHYKFNRVPTVRENARLQSFPDNFIFLGNKTAQYRQVGNAVPPLLGYHIALKLKEVLEK
jgi:DNA (cytosine-5)-methyltransferase 1